MRQAKVQIVYNAKDISKDIAPYLLSFEYTDNESHKADSINITLEDKNQIWIKPWLPAKGDTITATIITTDWKKPGDIRSLPCGTFEVDEVELTGPPSVIQIKGISVPVTSTLRSETKNRAWERIDLKSIATDIAVANNVVLAYDSSCNPQYLRVEQTEMSDLAFLQGLCEKAAQSLKVGTKIDGQKVIAIYDERTYEAAPAVRTIDRLAGDVIHYSFKSKTAGTAKTATVTYSDPLTGKTTTGTFTDPNPTNNGVTLNINDCPDGEYDNELSSEETDDPDSGDEN